MVLQVLLLAALCLTSGQAATVFTLSTQFAKPTETSHTGSLAGGTMLFVDGTNLMTHDPNQIRILVGGRDCVFDHFLMRENYIECDTPTPADLNNLVDLPITIFFSGEPVKINPAANPTFTYSMDKTAVIYGVEPSQQSAFNNLAWFGSWKTEGDNSLYMEIRAANRHMEMLPEYSTYQSWGTSFISTRLGDNVAGEGEPKARLAAAYGFSLFHWMAKQYTLSGEPYYFKTLAEVNKLSFHSGSTAGGLTVTLKGAGFPTDASKVAVSIEGNPCAVQSAAFDTVTCVTGTRTSVEAGPTFEGAAGLKHHLWYGKRISDKATLLDEDADVNDIMPMAVSFPAHNDHYEEIFAERWVGFFKAPRTGSYTFFVSTDDGCEVWLSTDSDPANKVRIINFGSSTGYKDMLSRANTRSSDIDLAEGGLYYLEIWHQQWGGIAHFNLGVRVPTDGTVRTNLMPSVQQVSVTGADTIREVQRVSITGTPMGGKIAFAYKGKTSDPVDWPASGTEWACSDILKAIKPLGIPSLGCAVNRDSGLAYDFTFNYAWTDARSFIQGVMGNAQPSGLTSSVLQVTKPSKPLGGSYKLSWRNVLSDDIPLLTSASTLQAQLNANFTIYDNKLLVSGSSSVDGVNMQFIFSDSLNTDGNVPLITVNVEGITGGPDETVAVATVTEQFPSSTDQFWWAVPSEFFRTVEDYTNVHVAVDGQPALCRGNCAFQYDADSPKITSATYGPTVSLVGENLPAACDMISVTIGGADCPVTTCSTTSIDCTQNVGVVGTFKPKVFIEGSGLAIIDPAVTEVTYGLQITSVEPGVGSVGGGTLLTIIGTGFLPTLPYESYVQTVTVGDSPCEVQTSIGSSITCVTSPQTTTSEITVTVDTETANSSAFTYDPSISPTIANVSPAYASTIVSTTLTITGTNFDGTSSGSVTVFIGAVECYVTASTATSVTCNLHGGPSGSWLMVVRVPGRGNAVHEHYPLKFELDSITPSSGSLLGGTLLTLTGHGLSTRASQLLILVVDQTHKCKVVGTPTETQVQCRTPPVDTFATDQPLETILLGRLQEDAVCIGTCTFTYSATATPVITGLSVTTGPAGTAVNINGTGFGTNVASTTVLFGTTAATVTSTSTTQVQVSVPNQAAGVYSVSVTFDELGTASGDFSFTQQLAVTSITPLTGSQGGADVTISGSGFASTAAVSFGGVACKKTTISVDTILCRVAPGTSTTAQLLSITQGTLSFTCATAATCGFTYSAALTPTVASATAAGTTVTINGTGFSATVADMVASIGEVPCTVTASTTTKVTATCAPPSGAQLVEVSTANKGYATGSVKITTTFAASGASGEGSFAGGSDITLTGSGLGPNTSVTVCGFPCAVTSATYSAFTCSSPTLASEFSQAEYGLVSNTTEITTGITGSAAVSGFPLSALFDSDYTTYFKTNDATCFLQFDATVGRKLWLNAVTFYPAEDSISTYKSMIDTNVSISDDGTTWTVIHTFDVLLAGWNVWNVPVNQEEIDPVYKARYFRVDFPAASKCRLAEFKLQGVVMSTETQPTLACSVLAQDSGAATAVSAGTFTYKQAATPVITAVDPITGTVAGGTELTFTGTSLASVTAVMIDNVECALGTLSDTSFTCTTGARTELQPPSIVVWTASGKAVLAGVKFLYADRWSSPLTWGGEVPPKEGETVQIPVGMTILLDIPTPKLLLLLIEGALIVEDKPGITLDAQYIFIKEGLFQVGTPSAPFQNEFTITLHGRRESPMMPIYGNKVLAVHSGVLDMHGIPRSVTWTSLAYTVNPGDSELEVQVETDWKVGESIVVASTSFVHEEAEMRVITSVVGGTKFTVDKPFEYKHYAATETYGTQTIDMRAEVGLLTRNLHIRGSEEGLDQEHGAHVMAFAPGDDKVVARISYLEIYNAGQAYSIGAYPFHFHMIGAVRNSFIIGNSIHHTFNRAVTIHGISFLRVIDNVCYHTKGHTIFLEDGAETKNRIIHNLIVSVRRSWSRLNTDTTPAGIWATNPDNYIVGNHIAGTDAYGLWYDFKPNPTGPSATTLICPIGTPLGESRDNVGHSCEKYGFRLFHGHVPVTYPCKPATNPDADDPWADNPPVTAIYRDFTGYKNKRNGAIADRIGDVRFHNFKVADNILAGIEITYTLDTPPFTIAFVSGALIIGKSGNTEPDVDMTGSIGFIGPQSDGLIAENMAFFNFDDTMFSLGDESHSQACTTRDHGGRHNQLRGLSFTDANKRVHWEYPRRSFYEILDDSMTGHAGAYVAAFWPHLIWEPYCVLDELTYNGVVCDGTKVLRRVHMLYPEPSQTFALMQITVRRAAGDNIPMGTRRFLQEPNYWWSSMQPVGGAQYHSVPKSWAIPMILGTEYLVHWGTTPMDWTSMIIRAETFDDPSQWVIVRFNFTDHRERFEVRRGVLPADANTTDPAFVDPRLLPMNATLLPDSPCGASRFDNVTEMEFATIITGQPVPRNSSGDLSVTAYRCFGGHCTLSTIAENVTMEAFERRWSLPESWPSGAVPVDGERVEIFPEWTMILDTETAVLSFLEVNGVLVFDNYTSATLNAEMIFVRKGKILSGLEDKPLLPNVTHQIVVHGTFDSTAFAFDPSIEVVNKAFIVTGEMRLFGARRKPWVHLVQNALPGDNFIFVERTNWQVGDEIVLASGSFYPSETETATVASVLGTYSLSTLVDDEIDLIEDADWVAKEGSKENGQLDAPLYEHEYSSADTKLVTKIGLSEPLQFYHPGTLMLLEDDKQMDMRCEVGVLTSNILIRGTENGWACNFVVADFVDYNVEASNPLLRSGRVTLDSVAFDYCGQNSTLRTGLRFESTTVASKVSNSIVKRSQTYSVNIQNSRNITLLNNVFFQAVRFGVFVQHSTDLWLEGNLMLNVTQRLTVSLPFDKPTCYVICPSERGSCTNVTLKSNVAAGYPLVGFADGGSACGSTPTFIDNVAHSGQVGWMTSTIGGNCMEASGFTTYFNQETAIIGSMTSQRMSLSGLRIAESMNGYGGNMGSDMEEGNRVKISDSVIVGRTVHSKCNPADCLTPQCGNRRGILLGSYVSESKQWTINGKIKLPVYNVTTEALFEARFEYDDIHFYDFQTVETCKANITAIASNELCPDYTPLHVFSHVKLRNVATDSVFFMSDPDPMWQALIFCGEFPCTGLKNVVVRDLDGGLVGNNYGGYLLPNNPGITVDDACEFIEKSNGFMCRKSPIDDIDYAILEFENLDIDARDVTVSPIYITSPDTILNAESAHFHNKLNSFMSHKWDGFYVGTNRLGRFPTAIGLNRPFNVTFTATAPVKLRFQLQGAPRAEDSVMLTVNYKEPYRVKVRLNGTEIPSLSVKKTVTLDSPSGTNKWLREERMLQFVIRSWDDIQLEKIDSISVSVRMDMTTEQFFASNGETEFIDRLCAVLGIPAYRVRVVDVRKGSTIVDAWLDPDSSLSAQLPTNPTFGSAMQEELFKIHEKLKMLAETGTLRLNAPVLSVVTDLLGAIPGSPVDTTPSTPSTPPPTPPSTGGSTPANPGTSGPAPYTPPSPPQEPPTQPPNGPPISYPTTNPPTPTTPTEQGGENPIDKEESSGDSDALLQWWGYLLISLACAAVLLSVIVYVWLKVRSKKLIRVTPEELDVHEKEPAMKSEDADSAGALSK